MQHTLILSLPKFDIPYQPNAIDIINTAIENNLVNIDYFGQELDNDTDYIDSEMKIKIASTTYITIHFDYNLPKKLSYESIEDEILGFIISILKEKPVQKVSFNEKGIGIYMG
ncbi:MAG TPA: hypothetical protein VF842_04870 [Flavobacterium sp.]